MEKLALGTLVLVTVLEFLFISHPAAAQVASQSSNNSQTTSVEREYQFLKDQTIDFKNYIQREREGYQKFFEIFLLVIAGLVGFATLIGVGSYINALNNVKKLGAKAITDAIKEKEGVVWDTLNEIAKRVYNERSNLQKKILVLSQSEDELKQGEIEGLKRRGFKKIEVRQSNTEFDLGSVSAIVFVHQPSADNLLSELIKKLITDGSKLPLIVYSSGRVDNRDLEGYAWRTFANTPLTLINAVFMSLSSGE